MRKFLVAVAVLMCVGVASAGTMLYSLDGNPDSTIVSDTYVHDTGIIPVPAGYQMWVYGIIIFNNNGSSAQSVWLHDTNTVTGASDLSNSYYRMRPVVPGNAYNPVVIPIPANKAILFTRGFATRTHTGVAGIYWWVFYKMYPIGTVKP